jgi:hypothetical protein
LSRGNWDCFPEIFPAAVPIFVEFALPRERAAVVVRPNLDAIQVQWLRASIVNH